jgi:putative sporulation protein YtaF
MVSSALLFAYSNAGGTNMWKYISMAMLAFAVSMDSLSVGVTYGMKNIRFPRRSIMIIACMSGVMLLLSMYVGNLFLLLLPMQAERWIAACLLIALGIWAIYNVIKKDEDEYDYSEPLPKQLGIKVWRFHIERFGIVIQVLKRPTLADLDRSGSISIKEALLIGLALSMDAFGAGLSASFLGYSPFMLALFVCILNVIFIRLGLRIGNMFAKTKVMKKAIVVPGMILIFLGIAKIFF